MTARAAAPEPGEYRCELEVQSEQALPRVARAAAAQEILGLVGPETSKLAVHGFHASCQ